jgi:hypothetical protein
MTDSIEKNICIKPKIPKFNNKGDERNQLKEKIIQAHYAKKSLYKKSCWLKVIK